jgi:hypothetical protein
LATLFFPKFRATLADNKNISFSFKAYPICGSVKTSCHFTKKHFYPSSFFLAVSEKTKQATPLKAMRPPLVARCPVSSNKLAR